MSVNTDGYLDADAAAQLLRVRRRSLYQYVNREPGFPQPHKIGRTLLFNEAEIRAWREAHPGKPRQGM